MNHLHLFEYFHSNVSELMRYLSMNDEEKKQELVFLNTNLINRFNFLDDKYNDIAKVDDLEAIEALYDEYDNDDVMYEPESLIDALKAQYPAVYKLFLDYVYTSVKNDDYISDAQKPTWMFLTFKNIIKRDTWLVHLTSADAAADIKRNGFKKGVNDMTVLGLTTHLSDYHKQDGGYNFAYTIPDFLQYARNTLNGESTFRYGSHLLLFQAAGVRCYHETDEEHQVIFNGESATNIKEIYCDRDAPDRDFEKLDVPMLFQTAGTKAVQSFLKSQDCMYNNTYRTKIQDFANLPDCLQQIKKWNVSVYSEIYNHFMYKLSSTGKWYILDSRGKVAHRSNEADDLLTWFQQNQHQVK